MKTKQEIDELYHKCWDDFSNKYDDNLHYYSFVEGYTQCQEDMAKELIEWIEITLSAESKLNVKYKIESLNKQERKEIQPNDIWNKESQDKIKEHILNLSKKQTPKDILETELMAKKYTEEDIRKAILLSATSDTDFIPDRCEQDNEK